MASSSCPDLALELAIPIRAGIQVRSEDAARKYASRCLSISPQVRGVRLRKRQTTTPLRLGLPGEQFDVKIVKAGESPGQGVGYLEDGTMIVVEGGRDHIHETVRLAVTSVLQTSAGRMIFGRFEETIEKEEVGS